MEKINLSLEQVEEVVNELVGSEQTMESAMTYLDININQVADESISELNSEVFKCDWCGVWYDQSDNCGENTCFNCATEGKEDDEELDEDDYLDYGNDGEDEDLN